MIMLKVLILDDNNDDRNRLEHALQEAFHDKMEYQLSCFSNSTDPLIVEEEFDVYFLDIDMPERDGISVAKKIRERYSEAILIFVTSHDNLVFKSFEANPFQFVRKNVFVEDFKICMDLLIKKLHDPRLYFSFTIQTNIINVKFSDILYFEKFKNDLFIYTIDGSYRFRENLSYVEMQINHTDFVRTHHSYLVNLEHVKQLTDAIELWNGNVLPVSRMKAKEVREKYVRYLKGKI